MKQPGCSNSNDLDEEGRAMISHRIRGISVGAPVDENHASGYRPAKRYIFRVGGKPDFAGDAEQIFSFLFLYLPDGTIRQLIRLFDEKLETISGLEQKLPPHRM